MVVLPRAWHEHGLPSPLSPPSPTALYQSAVRVPPQTLGKQKNLLLENPNLPPNVQQAVSMICEEQILKTLVLVCTRSGFLAFFTLLQKQLDSRVVDISKHDKFDADVHGTRFSALVTDSEKHSKRHMSLYVSKCKSQGSRKRSRSQGRLLQWRLLQWRRLLQWHESPGATITMATITMATITSSLMGKFLNGQVLEWAQAPQTRIQLEGGDTCASNQGEEIHCERDQETHHTCEVPPRSG